MAFSAEAQTINLWWDNNKTSAATSGTWDNTTSNWSTTSALTASPVVFGAANTNFAEFAAGSTTISALTITVNSAVSCAGMATGISGALVTTTTFSGSGSISIPTNGGSALNGNYVQGFYCGNGNTGNFLYDVPLTGAGGLQQKGNGYIGLNANNTYSGGTYLTGGQVIYYYNNNSFGTGPIYIGGFGNAIVNNTSPAAALVITNSFIVPTSGYAVNLAGGNPVGGLPGTTYSGSFSLPVGVTTIETSSTATEVTLISGPISGTGGVSLVVSDIGTLELSGTNTFDGNMSLYTNLGAAGPTVNILGSGSLGGGNYAGNITNGGTFIYDSSVNQTLSGGISGIGTNGTLIVEGSGTLTLSGGNTYTNSTTIRSNGTLNANSIGDSGSSSIGTGPVTLGGGTIIYSGGGDTTARQWNGTAASTNTFDVPTGVTVTLNGRVTSTALWTVNYNSPGTLVLGGTADNSYLAMNINSGTVILDKTGPTGSAIGRSTVVNSGATLQFQGGYIQEIASNSSTTLTIASGGLLDLDGQTEGFYSLSLAGTGISGSGALINSAGSTTGILECAVTLTTNATIGGATSPGNITLTGGIGGLGGLTYAGTGTLSLGGTNTFTGGTTVSSGTLDINTTGSVVGTVSVTGTGLLELDNPYALSPFSTLVLPSSPAASTVNLNFSGTQEIVALVIGSTVMPAGVYGVGANNPNSVFTGTGLINVVATYWDANGTDAAHGANTFGGGSGSWDSSSANWWLSGNIDVTWPPTNVAYFGGTAGTVTLNASETTAGLFITTAGYTLTNTDGVSALTLSGGSPIISIPAGATAISCNLTGGGTNLGLTISGPGTLSLSGSNTYTGGTLINGGAVVSVNNISDSGSSALGNTGNVTLAGGTLSYPGSGSPSTARTIVATAGTSNIIDVPLGTLNLNGPVTSSTIGKTGSGTLVLGGTNDNSGLGLTIQGGLVVINKTSASTAHGLGGTSSSVASGAELQLSGSGNYDLYSGCILTINSGGVFDVNSQSDSFSTLTLSGTGIGGSGALINSTTTATSGLTNSGGVVLAGPTTIGGPGNITLYSAISGSGMPLTYAGTGTLTLVPVGTYTGGTTVNAGGTLQLNNGSTTNSSAGTGTITLNGNAILNLNLTNTEMNNAITGGSNSLINISMGSGNLWLSNSPANQLSNFSGTFNINSTSPTGGQLVVGTATLIETINSGAIWQIHSGVVVDFNVSQTNPATVYLYGAPYTGAANGSLRLDNSVQSGPVILMGNSQIGNASTNGPSTISGVISDGGIGYGFAKVGADPVVLSATNTYSGATTISNGTLQIGGAGLLGSGNYATNLTNNAIFNYASSMPQTLSGVVSGTGALVASGAGTLTLADTNIFTGGILITNGGTLAIGGAGSLGATATSNNYAVNITNYGTFSYGSSAAQTLSGIMSGTGALIENGPGTLTLNSADTYSGATTVNAGGTLALSTSGTFNASPSLYLAQGGIFDVSAYGLAYTLGGTTTLRPSGKGIGVGSSAATINGGAGTTINVGSLVLTYSPRGFTGDATHPALYVSQGSLSLSGSGLVVSNAAVSPLGVGTYSLIQVASQGLTVAYTNVSVTGTGLAAGTTASLGLTNGSLNLVVASSGAVPTPVINSFTHSGGNIIFSGTNGPANGTYYVLTTTNVALNLTNWTAVATNTFSPTGTFSVTNAIGGGQGFYAIEVP